MVDERRLRRASPTPGSEQLPVFLLLLVAALAAAVVRQGAYYPDGQRLVGPLLAAAVIAAVVARPAVRRTSRVGPGTFAAAFAAWAVVSGVLAGDAGAAMAPAALVAAVVAVLAVCRRTTRAERESLAAAALAVGTLCALTGWVGVAWRVQPLALEDQALWRAASTLTYANATAALLVPLALLALAMTVLRPRAWLPAATAGVLLMGAAATLSRGGAMALLVGAAVLAVLLGPRALARASVAPAAGAAVAFAGLVPSMPAGGPPRPALAVGALVAGMAVTALLVSARRPGKVAVALAGLILVALAGPLASGWSDITGPRLTLSSPDRADETAAALRLVAAQPLTGTGPGNATLAWAGDDGRTMIARYVHNEYLQVLAELGVVGLGLLAGLLLTAGRRVGAGRASAPSPQLWAGAVAGLVALLVHSGFDFLWHVAALPLVAAVLAGISSPSDTEELA